MAGRHAAIDALVHRFYNGDPAEALRGLAGELVTPEAVAYLEVAAPDLHSMLMTAGRAALAARSAGTAKGEA